MEILGYIAAVLTGIALGLFGAGGSVLTMPTLVYLFDIDPVRATAYSLFVVGITALGGATGYIRRNWIDYWAVVGFGLPSVLGVLLARHYVMPAIPDSFTVVGEFELTKNVLIMVAFALLMLGSGIAMIRGRSEAKKPEGSQAADGHSPIWYLIVVSEGLVVGLVTGIVGAGGGFLIVPGLVLLVGLPVREAVGTSLAIIAVKSLLGSASEIVTFSTIEWSFLVKFCIATTVGMGIGIGFSRYVSPDRLKSSFGVLVLFMGVVVLISELT